MLGKSVGARRIATALALLLATATCARNVSQDAKSGPDGKAKGAKELTFDNNEARATGIVTYPGEDRVDWKSITLPEKKRGTLDIKLTWTPPRPGLQLAFDVFDEWNRPVGDSKRQSKKRSRGRIRTATIPDARGKYLIRVYAVGRGDAGKYRLTIEFKDSGDMAGGVDLTKLEIPDPPKLSGVPEHVEPCNDLNFDPKKKECLRYCPTGGVGAPPGWPPCKDTCPTPPDKEIEACRKVMECPKPPDRRIAKCTKKHFPKCPDINNPDPDNPNCDDAKADPVLGTLIGASVSGNEVTIQVGVGSQQGVKKDWRGAVLLGTSNTPIPGGDFTPSRVDPKVTVGKVRLTIDQVNKNPRVKLSPP